MYSLVTGKDFYVAASAAVIFGSHSLHVARRPIAQQFFSNAVRIYGMKWVTMLTMLVAVYSDSLLTVHRRQAAVLVVTGNIWVIVRHVEHVTVGYVLSVRPLIALYP